MQDHAANHLYVVVAHLKKALATFAANCKRFNQNVVGRFALGQSILKLGRLSDKFVVGHCLVLALELSDGIDFGLKLFDLPRVGRTKQVGDRTFKSTDKSSTNVSGVVPDFFQEFHDEFPAGKYFRLYKYWFSKMSAGFSSQPDIKRNFGADVNGAAKVYLSRVNPY